MKPIHDIFHQMVSGLIDKTGIFPHQMIIARMAEIEMMSFDTNRLTLVHAAAASALADPDTTALMFGIDRTALDGQGTEFKDVLVCPHWTRRGGWRVAVLNYQHTPRIVRPWDWNNPFWIETATREMFVTGLIPANQVDMVKAGAPIAASLSNIPATVDGETGAC